MKQPHGRAILLGNYCHDTLLKDDNTIIAQSLGGAASFISNIFSHLSIACTYISKVGTDFNHTARVITPPIVSPNSKTTLFHAHFGKPNGPDRAHACGPVWPGDGERIDLESDFGLKPVSDRVNARDPVRPGDLPMSERFDLETKIGPKPASDWVNACDPVKPGDSPMGERFDHESEILFEVGLKPVSDRALYRVNACDPIRPGDLPMGERFDLGLAVGVGGEILPETLEKLIEICGVVFVDIQGLIREFDENDGKVRLINLKDTEFYPLMGKVGFLKASSEEAEFFDVEEVRKMCCVIVTNGEKGCKVYWKDGEVEISPFRAVQVDPTGAGDSLLGGFVAGLVFGLCVPDAALLGNFFGALTVSEIGLPKFDHKLLERVKDEAQNRVSQYAQHQVGVSDELCFSKPLGHEQFYASLDSIRRAFSLPTQECKKDQQDTHNLTTTVDLSVKHQCNGQ